MKIEDLKVEYDKLQKRYGAKELDSISFNLVRVPYDIQKEINALQTSNLPNKNMVIRRKRL